MIEKNEVHESRRQSVSSCNSSCLSIAENVPDRDLLHVPYKSSTLHTKGVGRFNSAEEALELKAEFLAKLKFVWPEKKLTKDIKFR